ncbi:sigma-54-dependent transcriptional regulator [Desulfopila inferna]|uniref:sigma-54-dependent transcriptional regulator n=1 Tax=Desulfopila inferna TaxID=468528 RepID=UPI00196432B0|nr:sigma-54 dependent transcriptional regulator [Desulfopila inferna]MBM9606473.1 sigma-54-dependent Fis family transcriptional regulator [Desulfopila inferna]
MPDTNLKVLVIDNETTVAEALRKVSDQLGIVVRNASTLQEGIQAKGNEGFAVVLMRDILPDGASCYAIEDYQSLHPSPEILIYTAVGDPEHAEHALKGGVWDYIIDPSPHKKLPDLLKRVLRYRRNKGQNAVDKQREIQQQLEDTGIIGRSKAIRNCVNLTVRVAQSDASVLITGETGTGKELFASAIHNISPRARKNMTTVDCAALPSTLVESILFGHAKGSFTGADKSQTGLIKQADGGTLFLDEIGEMPLEIQKKLLRVIQERKFLPVGSNTEIESNFRLIAATNRNLELMVEEGTFREDLFFRLKTFQLELPSLRRRTTDVTELAYHYRTLFCKRNKLKNKKLSPDYLMILNQYDWPGNVRELFQAVERSITDAQDSTILDPTHLPLNIRLAVTKKKLNRGKKPLTETAEAENEIVEISNIPTIKEARDRAIQLEERKYLQQLLELTDGDIKLCCQTAGLSRSRLYDLLKKYELSNKETSLNIQEETE